MMGLNVAEAHAVSTLLDYYLEPTERHQGGGAEPSQKHVLEAWLTLTKGAHARLGAGWREADVDKHFQAKTNGLTDHSDDPEDCRACSTVNDVCPYHRGIGIGQDEAWRGAAKAMEAFVYDPELLTGLLANYDRAQEVDQQHQEQREVRRIAIDADCPGCGWAERWFDPLWKVFGCAKCSYTSKDRES